MLTHGDVACWLLKTARLPAELVSGTTTVLDRCLRPSYRLDLMVPGQRCLLWLSGRQAGVVALGTLIEAPDRTGPPEVRVALRRLPEPVPRTDLLPTPFATAEVIRMPFGSNPSYLDRSQLTTLLDHLPPVRW